VSPTQKSILIVILILVADQVSKVLVKTNMTMGQEVHVIGNWFLLHFTENNGMAFGINMPGNYGKIVLTLFRVLAVIAITFYLRYLITRDSHMGLLIAKSFILAGAVGNIIDSVFYGVIFEDSWGRVATMFPEGGGYSTILQGRVVDMLYFPVIRGNWPEWFPWLGGSQLIFFRPVFNIADSSITVGVFIVLVFQKRFFALVEENTGENKESQEIQSTK